MLTLSNGMHCVAVVGINRECAELLCALAGSDTLRVVRILNPQIEDLRDLERCVPLDLIIDATGDERVAQRIAGLRLGRADVISGLSARILFSAGDDGFLSLRSREQRANILNSLGEIRRAVHVARDKEQLLRLVESLSRKIATIDQFGMLDTSVLGEAASIANATN